MSDKSVSDNLFHAICRDSVHYVWEHYRGPLTLTELMARPIPRLMQLTFEQYFHTITECFEKGQKVTFKQVDDVEERKGTIVEPVGNTSELDYPTGWLIKLENGEEIPVATQDIITEPKKEKE